MQLDVKCVTHALGRRSLPTLSMKELNTPLPLQISWISASLLVVHSVGLEPINGKVIPWFFGASILFSTHECGIHAQVYFPNFFGTHSSQRGWPQLSAVGPFGPGPSSPYPMQNCAKTWVALWDLRGQTASLASSS